jgi:hypothetical protein
VRRFEQLEQFDRLIARITDLRQHNVTAQGIADRLNAEGWRPPKKPVFDAAMIRCLLQRRGLGTRRPIWSGNVPRESDDEMMMWTAPPKRHQVPRRGRWRATNGETVHK